MEQNARQIRALAEILKGQNISINGGTHSIYLEGSEEILDVAVEKDLIRCDFFLEDDDNVGFIQDNHTSKIIMKARDITRTCFECDKGLSFNEFYTSNLKDYPKKQAAKLWCREEIEFFCCDCFERLKCPNCMKKLGFSLESGRPFYYCLECLKTQLSKINEELREVNESQSVKLLSGLNFFINRLNFNEAS